MIDGYTTEHLEEALFYLAKKDDTIAVYLEQYRLGNRSWEETLLAIAFALSVQVESMMEYIYTIDGGKEWLEHNSLFLKTFEYKQLRDQKNAKKLPE